MSYLIHDTEKYAETLMSMCTDFLVGGITEETFVANLKVFADQAERNLAEKKSRDGK